MNLAGLLIAERLHGRLTLWMLTSEKLMTLHLDVARSFLLSELSLATPLCRINII